MPTQQEILFLFSGGLSNQDPTKSLGGPMSNTVILNGMDNLFEDITLEEGYGFTDYRCFYIKNGSNNEWRDVIIYMTNQYDPGCATGWLGIEEADDIQQFNVISEYGAIGGSFSFNIESYDNITVNFDYDIGQWATNFQDALISLGFEVIVTGETFQDNTQNKTFQIFQIEFIGNDSHRDQDLITPNENNLIMYGYDTSTLTTSRISHGMPINIEAELVSNTLIPPTNVVFTPTDINAPIVIGILKPGDSVPVWIKRSSELNITVETSDKFIVTLRGEASLF